MIMKPFTVNIEKPVVEDFVKPFTIDCDYVQTKEQELQTGNAEKQTKEEARGIMPVSPQVQMLRPFNYVSADVAKIAEAMSADDRKLSMYLAEAVNKYVAEGGDVQQLIRRAKENKKTQGFNFVMELKKMISYIFDSSEGEIREVYYGIEINVYKANGKTSKIN